MESIDKKTHVGLKAYEREAASQKASPVHMGPHGSTCVTSVKISISLALCV